MIEFTRKDVLRWFGAHEVGKAEEYIPRVLAFTTLYDWRLQRPVSRVSSRMPAFDSAVGGGTMQAGETVEVVCPAPG